MTELKASRCMCKEAALAHSKAVLATGLAKNDKGHLCTILKASKQRCIKYRQLYSNIKMILTLHTVETYHQQYLDIE